MAAEGPNVEILRDLLAKGATVHVRNHADHTPLWLATERRRDENVGVLRSAGAHLYLSENRDLGP